MQFSNIHKSLARELLMCIEVDREQALITYGEMCNRANNIIDPRTSSGYIGDLSLFCYENDMPLISVMVVNGDTYMPGAGFFRLYTDLTGNKVDTDNEFNVFKEELKKVREYEHWDRLSDLLGLNIKMSNHKKNTKEENQTNNSKKSEDNKSYEEGKVKLETHKKRERNFKVVKEAKALFIKNNGRLYCELCGFDFEKVYGELGSGFIEGHHIKPVSQMKDGDVTKVEDIKMLCSNCHKMVHRGIVKGIDIEEIIK